MICKECHKEGKTSRIFIGPSSVTAMYFPPYYDEEGNHHHHDNNIVITNYKCSNNHAWRERSDPPKCPNCEWPN